MKFEWDDDKNQANIRKHGISFERATRIFAHLTINIVDDRKDYGELRTISIGVLDDEIEEVIVAVVHTSRTGRLRLISARKASKDERKHYEKVRQALDD